MCMRLCYVSILLQMLKLICVVALMCLLLIMGPLLASDRHLISSLKTSRVRPNFTEKLKRTLTKVIKNGPYIFDVTELLRAK